MGSALCCVLERRKPRHDAYNERSHGRPAAASIIISSWIWSSHKAQAQKNKKEIRKRKEEKKKNVLFLHFFFFFSYLSHTHYTIQRDSSSLLLSCSFFVSFFFFFIPQFLLESILLCNHSNWDHGTTESISRLRCQQNTAQPITFLLTIFPQGVLSVCADVRVFHHVHHEPLELAPTHHHNYRNLGIVYTQLLWLPTI